MRKEQRGKPPRVRINVRLVMPFRMLQSHFSGRHCLGYSRSIQASGPFVGRIVGHPEVVHVLTDYSCLARFSHQGFCGSIPGHDFGG